MLEYDKIYLLSNLEKLYDLLKSNNANSSSLYNCKCIYQTRIAIKHSIYKKINRIQIWRTKSLFDYWYDDFHYCSKNFIGGLDYIVHDTFIKIIHLNINDGEIKNLYNHCLNEYDAEELVNSLISFVKLVAKKENKKKIMIDVHHNLRIFMKYYWHHGFETTNRKCIDNPFWIESELILI